MKAIFLRAALGAAAFAAVSGVSPAFAQQTVTFLCNAPAGHVCQFQINTASGPINFPLPSGQRTEIANIRPHADTYCVCDPGPVTADCKAPRLDHWCLGSWLAVDPGLNSQNDIANDRFAAGREGPAALRRTADEQD
ncbi:hypothetical protein DFR50_102180 [Roseiarcus fermentans]|uniref:Uncharacterized protein n=1 Tax=Roseiarcus fermentans TaxID=1473586 RepID=A0A366FST8_9HYPH|nr:hypothetical protein [Roseiarcus fermentans]RBP17688.1 hypothetical protein DFR50_102180 [Roseiarcus fermentans]